jgi:hypothetical protein
MKMSDKIDIIMPALLKVKLEMEAVSKDSINPHFRSKFSSLNNYLESIEPLLQKNKMVLLQPSTRDSIETIIFHAESGQYVSSEIKIPDNVIDPQKMGSLFSYFRRYALAGLLAFQTNDDNDAEGFVRPNEKFIAKPTTIETVKPIAKTTETITPTVKREFSKPSKPTTTGGSEWN